MNNSKYQHQLGVNVACTKRMNEETKGIGRRGIKGDTKDCFIFESCFSSNNLAEFTMDVGEYLIGKVKTNKKGSLRISLIILQRIGQYFLTSCWGAIL